MIRSATQSLAFTLFAALLSIAAPVYASTTLRVLFVGNSLTYYNDVPSMVAALVRASDSGAVVESDMLADGGATMRDHLTDGAFARVLESTHYDIVVLQDRGGYPLCSRGDEACADSVAAMCEASSRTMAAHARAIWYGTWQLIQPAQEALSEEGRHAAMKCGMEFADVGAAMQRAQKRGLTDLWLDDGHPAAYGSWVAASVLARKIVAHQLPARVAIDPVCRRHWESSQLTRKELASRQQASAKDCDAPDVHKLSIAVSAANSSDR